MDSVLRLIGIFQPYNGGLSTQLFYKAWLDDNTIDQGLFFRRVGKVIAKQRFNGCSSRQVYGGVVSWHAF